MTITINIELLHILAKIVPDMKIIDLIELLAK